MTGVFLQVRLDSSRLPNKALLELGGRSVIEHAMLSLRRLPVSVHAILTDCESAELLRPRAGRCGFECFVGPEENVLERYVLAARHYRVDTVVRATGDNPLVSWELARLAVRELHRREADYFGFDGPPLGTGIEAVRAAALERAIRSTKERYELEHVTPFIYRNPEQFRVIRTICPVVYRLPKMSVTLDTGEQYRDLCEIFTRLYDGSPVSVFRLIRHLSTPETGRIADQLHADSSGA